MIINLCSSFYAFSILADLLLTVDDGYFTCNSTLCNLMQSW